MSSVSDVDRKANNTSVDNLLDKVAVESARNSLEVEKSVGVSMKAAAKAKQVG